MTFVAVLLVSALLSLAFTPAVRAIAERFDVVDRPGARKIHRLAVARLGGLAVALSAAVALAAVAALAPRFGWSPIAPGGELLPVIAGGAIVFAVGLWDDVSPVPPAGKMLVEAIAAALVIGSGATIARVTLGGATYELGLLAVPVTLVWILAITNAFNLIDGLDGLAAGLGVIAAATCAAILVVRGHRPEAVLLLAVLGATAGFLPYNFYPASIFLGDAGSLLIGFLLAVTALTGWQKGATVLAVGVPMLIFAVPIVDIASSVARRAGRRPDSTSAPSSAASSAASRFPWLDRVFQPDQEHIHHRLMAGGLSHRGTVLLLYALALALSGIALLTFQAP